MTYHDDEGCASPELFKIGRDGPLHISPGALIPELEEFQEKLAQAWTSKGQKLTDNIYNRLQDGLFKSINSTYKGLRSSSWVFVDGKANVRILPQTIATKVKFNQDNVATGVTVIHNSTEVTFTAKREVIVSSGVFETPKLLMFSGIGPKDALAEHKLQPLVESSLLVRICSTILFYPTCSEFRMDTGWMARCSAPVR